MSKLAREVVFEAELQAGIERGLEKAFNVAKAAYGPAAGNVLLEQNYGDPLLSRDGVTNLRRLYVADPVENMAIRTVAQASNKSNRVAGDGTTAVTILAYHLYTEARKLVAAGYNRMEIARLLESTAQEVISQVQALAKPVNPPLLQKVCRISAGDVAIGDMISDVVGAVGADGGITVEDFGGAGIYSDVVDGFHFGKGFTSLQLINDPSNLESRHIDVPILISEKRLMNTVDIAPLLDKIASAGIMEVVIVGEVGPEALELLLINRMKGIISCIPVEPPVHEGMRTLFLSDLALVTGGKVVAPAVTGVDFSTDMLGYAGKVVINEFSTTIVGPDGLTEDVSLRVSELQSQLADATSEVTINALRDRISRLTGKIGVIKVGGVTEQEQSEVKLRVEDAIAAGQAAARSGILPGGGVTLARVKVNDFQRAYTQPFLQLCENAGLNSELLLGKVQSAKPWRGFDLRNLEDKPTDMLESGVIDPALVIEEVVRNATSVAAGLITSTAGLYFADRDVKSD
jgi:chaperonin GroEL